MKRFFNNSKGDTEMIVLIVVIIGAFLLMGGQFFFQKTKSHTGANGGNSSGGNGGNGSTSSDWKIEQVVGKTGCSSGKSQVEIALHGTAAGFYKIEVGTSSTTYTPVLINGSVYNSFTPNSQNIQVNDLSLSNSDGFNTKPWQVTLYQGGVLSGNQLTNGVEKVKQGFNATSCP